LQEVSEQEPQGNWLIGEAIFLIPLNHSRPMKFSKQTQSDIRPKHTHARGQTLLACIKNEQRWGLRFWRPRIDLLKRALESAGIEFIDENGGGAGVRLRKRQRPKQPK
jgi:hypothetical protein